MKMRNAVRAAVVGVLTAGAVAMSTPAQAASGWFPPAPAGYEWEDYCGIDILLRHGTWCKWVLVRIP